jgi:DNA-binding transcriptional LysR family regulator
MAWDDFQVFLAVHRTGSHARAGRALGVDPTTIGRRLAALEAELGARLFDRTPAGLTATPSAQALVPRLQRVEAELLAAEQELHGADARIAGPVRITASDGLVNYVLVPALVALRRRHPGLAIELGSETRTLDLSRREADVAVRLVRPKEPALVARKLGTMPFSLYASRAYLEHNGTPRSTAELERHDWIGFEAALDRLPQVTWLRRTVPRLRYAIRANTTAIHVAACAAGHGLALLPSFIAGHEPDLVPVLPRLAGPTRDVWAVAHTAMRRNARVALILAWLSSVVERGLGTKVHLVDEAEVGPVPPLRRQ